MPLLSATVALTPERLLVEIGDVRAVVHSFSFICRSQKTNGQVPLVILFIIASSPCPFSCMQIHLSSVETYASYGLSMHIPAVCNSRVEDSNFSTVLLHPSRKPAAGCTLNLWFKSYSSALT